MSDSLETVKKLIQACTDEDREALGHYLGSCLPSHPLETEWGIDARTILNAIHRSPDLTKRGVRGIIAEAVFEAKVLPTVINRGWRPEIIPPGGWPYDVLLQKGEVRARIQVKLQRLEKGSPKRFYPQQYAEELFAVEVQKTRTGKKRTRREGIGSAASQSEDTRPYRFGDFDILAVNMHPATRQWESFRYTLGNWLLARLDHTSLIEIFQPVSPVPNDVWTDDLGICLEWFLKGEQKKVIERKHSKRIKNRILGSSSPN